MKLLIQILLKEKEIHIDHWIENLGALPLKKFVCGRFDSTVHWIFLKIPWKFYIIGVAAKINIQLVKLAVKHDSKKTKKKHMNSLVCSSDGFYYIYQLLYINSILLWSFLFLFFSGRVWMHVSPESEKTLMVWLMSFHLESNASDLYEIILKIISHGKK